MSVKRKGKQAEDPLTKLLKAKRDAELKVSTQEASVKKAFEKLEEQIKGNEFVGKMLKHLRDQKELKDKSHEEGLKMINSFIEALHVRLAYFRDFSLSLLSFSSYLHLTFFLFFLHFFLATHNTFNTFLDVGHVQGHPIRAQRGQGGIRERQCSL